MFTTLMERKRCFPLCLRTRWRLNFRHFQMCIFNLRLQTSAKTHRTSCQFHTLDVFVKLSDSLLTFRKIYSPSEGDCMSQLRDDAEDEPWSYQEVPLHWTLFKSAEWVRSRESFQCILLTEPRIQKPMAQNSMLMRRFAALHSTIHSQISFTRAFAVYCYLSSDKILSENALH